VVVPNHYLLHALSLGTSGLSMSSLRPARVVIFQKDAGFHKEIRIYRRPIKTSRASQMAGKSCGKVGRPHAQPTELVGWRWLDSFVGELVLVV
jgi:hypothetical protein